MFAQHGEVSGDCAVPCPSERGNFVGLIFMKLEWISRTREEPERPMFSKPHGRKRFGVSVDRRSCHKGSRWYKWPPLITRTVSSPSEPGGELYCFRWSARFTEAWPSWSCLVRWGDLLEGLCLHSSGGRNGTSDWHWVRTLA